jgi:molecular chaperone DnaK (HSP70)
MSYLIGVDLGTTNTVVYYMDAEKEDASPEALKIPQVTERGEVSESELLPSFIYIPDENELPEGALNLPWNDKMSFCAGEFAKKNAAVLPSKTVSSAKSWLCVESIDRLAPVLPPDRRAPDKQISPVEASRRILEHVKNAWNNEFKGKKDKRFEDQTIVLTVPASFDAAARDLTVKAAGEAGFKPVLLEEPLAAFYAWLQQSGETWRSEVTPGDVILVCDIGGGTSDFTLVKVVDEGGNLSFERLAVGRHILLGGDNMDLTAAHAAAAKIKEEKDIDLDSWQISGLVHACRAAKETLLGSEDAPPQKLTVLGRGSSVVGKTLSAKISKEELSAIILDGFFPKCGKDEAPARSVRAGLRLFGLSYESDPAVTKHLAEFIAKNAPGPEMFPTKVLLNGGVTKSPLIKQRILDTISSWAPDGKEVKALSGADPDMAVARGGCWYANVRRGKAIRIKAGSPRSYYIGIEPAMPAVPGFTPPVKGLCVIPFGMEEGTETDVPCAGLALLVGEPTCFKFYSSDARKTDPAGELVENADRSKELTETPSLTATLKADGGALPGSFVPIASIRGALLETGVLQIWCKGEKDSGEWKLEFDPGVRNEK